MIAILSDFINMLLLQAGFILSNMIHWLLTPVGAVMAVSLLVYLEYVAIKSITKDMRGVLMYLNNHKLKNAFLASFQSTILSRILKRKNIYTKNMPNIVNIPIVTTKKLVSGLIE